jgi:hypothetical protein
MWSITRCVAAWLRRYEQYASLGRALHEAALADNGTTLPVGGVTTERDRAAHALNAKRFSVLVIDLVQPGLGVRDHQLADQVGHG